MGDETSAPPQGIPIEWGPDGKMLAPGVLPALPDDGPTDRWQGLDESTTLLVGVIEACKEITFAAERIDIKNKARAIKNLAVPACALADIGVRLRTSLDNKRNPRAAASRSIWPEHDQRNYVELGRQMAAERHGPLRDVRDKLGAHVDPTAIGSKTIRVRIDDVLPLVCYSLGFVMLALNHDTFAWVRWLNPTGDGRRYIETTFDYPICIRQEVDASGTAIGIDRFQIAEDPRTEIRSDLLAAIEAYKRLHKAYESTAPIIEARFQAPPRPAE